jgi:phenylalanyl-tRNA synthetase alpha chain
MVRFGIPDIRLFWSTDERFLGQFDASKPLDEMTFQVQFLRACTTAMPQTRLAPLYYLYLSTTSLLPDLVPTPNVLQPFSKYPAVDRDVTFWIPDDFSGNNFADLVRSVAGDLAETVTMVKNCCSSRCADTCADQRWLPL